MTDNEWPKSVRTTIRPDEPVSVYEPEYLDLQRAGLLLGNQVTRDDDHGDQADELVAEPVAEKTTGRGPLFRPPPAKKTPAKKAATKAADTEKGTNAP